MVFEDFLCFGINFFTAGSWGRQDVSFFPSVFGKSQFEFKARWNMFLEEKPVKIIKYTSTIS